MGTEYHAPISMSMNLINNLLDPVDPQDAATRHFVEQFIAGGGGAEEVAVQDTPPTDLNIKLWVDTSTAREA